MQYQFEKIKHYATSPDKIVQELVRPFRTFFGNEASSSILLIGATLLAVAWTNSPFGYTYHRFWETSLSFSVGDASITRTLRQWIDEGLMAVFFFAMGLEIKREILVGELSSLKKALLPVGAALGGMLLPAVIYALVNKGLPTSTGWGIPMATDIAFALGALFILGKRIPLGIPCCSRHSGRPRVSYRDRSLLFQRDLPALPLHLLSLLTAHCCSEPSLDTSNPYLCYSRCRPLGHCPRIGAPRNDCRRCGRSFHSGDRKVRYRHVSPKREQASGCVLMPPCRMRTFDSQGRETFEFSPLDRARLSPCGDPLAAA